jgi:DNA-directed RNA polymerase subunit beta'
LDAVNQFLVSDPNQEPPMNAGESDNGMSDETVRLCLASPADIRSWSSGEVTKAATINTQTHGLVEDGLFCERIFGPAKDWGQQQRWGHIELAAPVVHCWFVHVQSNQLGNLLDMTTASLKKIIYFQDYVVIDPRRTPLKERQLLTEEECRQARTRYGEDFEAGMGAEAIKKLIQRLNLVQLSRELRDSGLDGPPNQPEWMVLECIPVIPPSMRPLVLLDSGNFAAGDLNELYRRIINRNNRLKKLVDLNAPEVILRNENRMLQQSVDALFDNNRCKRPVLGSRNRPLQSLTDMLKSKQSPLRKNLLGKRVDYSARSVIVPGPALQLHQCGLPEKIALELFQPFVLRRLKELRHADTIASARKLLERKTGAVWDVLAEVMKNHPVLLNRPATLERLRIQAFEPVLVEGNAIRIHPLVCKSFNADFDGDQMIVHLPLSIEAQVEARVLLMATNNLHSPANGQPIISPSRDIVMGCYYLTADPLAAAESQDRIFASPAEVFLAYALKKVGIHARIQVRLPLEKKILTELRDEQTTGQRRPNGLVSTTVGRVIFNDLLHPQMAFYDLALSSKHLDRIIDDCQRQLGRRETIALLDRIKENGLGEATRSGLSLAMDDLRTPSNKPAVLLATEKKIDKLQRQFERVYITDLERYNKVIDHWSEANDHVTKQMMHELQHDVRDGTPYLNPIFLMMNSGACSGVEQIRPLAGMYGLVAKPSGLPFEMPITANFREGLSVLEYFCSTLAARKKRLNKVSKWGDSDYLMRKLIDAAGNVIVTTHDCGTTLGASKGPIGQGVQGIEQPLAKSIWGRVACNTLVDGRDGSVIVAENQMITREQANLIEALGIDKFRVRSPLACQATRGVCRLCYGMDLATGKLVEEGVAVGVIAAQSIGETSRQLPQAPATFLLGTAVCRIVLESEIWATQAGTVQLVNVQVVVNDQGDSVALTCNGELQILGPEDRVLETHPIPHGAILKVEDKQEVKPPIILAQIDPFWVPILAQCGGQIRLEEIAAGETLDKKGDQHSGIERWVIMEHKGDLHPRIVIKDEHDQSLEVCYLPQQAQIEVRDGQQVSPGTLLFKTPRQVGRTQYSSGSLHRVMELFEARPPREPAIIAEVAGRVELGERCHGKRSIFIQPLNDQGNACGTKCEHLVPQGKHLFVHGNEYVCAGDPLVEGPLVLHDILRIRGIEAVQNYLLREVESVYRLHRLDLDDKHIEIIVARMVRKVRVERPGAPGIAALQLVGVTQAARPLDSFIAATAHSEITRVLTEAALMGQRDELVGLEENQILGRLLPVGTGFRRTRT